MAMTVKAFASQVVGTCVSPSLRAVDAARVWIQGVVVARATDCQHFVIDDGTAVVTVDMRTFLQTTPPGHATMPQLGDLVMVIGPPQLQPLPLPRDGIVGEGNVSTVIAHQVVPVNDHEQQEALWTLEVIEYWKAVSATS